MKNFFHSKLAEIRLKPISMVLRRALCTAIAVFIAVVCDRYFSSLQKFWVCLTTVLVLQMTIRTSFRQEVLRLFVILTSVFILSLVYLNIHQDVVRDTLMIAIFVTGCFLHGFYQVKRNGFSPPLMIAFLALMMLVPYADSPHLIYDRLHDVMIGGVIGVVAGLLIFPGRPDVDFRTGIIPILDHYSLYLQVIAELLFRETDSEKKSQEIKVTIEKYLHARRAFFPDWVYEPGFNPNLRLGHRHFLARIEQVGEILFAMHYVARFPIDPALLEKLYEPIMQCITDAKKVLSNVGIVLNQAVLSAAASELPEDILNLQEAFRREVPLPLELLDMSPDYMHLAGFIYDLSDLQIVLSILSESLRGYISNEENS
jgi:hypothetical protein